MTAKEFFRGTAFRCLVVLLSIVLVCGILLTVCNSLFFVSSEERLQRAIAKIYGEQVQTETVAFEPAQAAFGKSTVTQAYKIVDDGNYLVLSTGTGGYGGSVSCWVVVKVVDNTITGLKSVSIESNQGETQLNNLNAAFYQKFIDGYNDEVEYATEDGYLVTGTTMSSNAICNAVNGAVMFVKTVVLGISVDTSTPYDEYAFTEKIDKTKTAHTVNGSLVTFTVVTESNSPAQPFTIEIAVGEGGVISSYTVVRDGSTADKYSDNVYRDYAGKNAAYFKGIIGEDGSNSENNNYADAGIPAGATRSNYLCLYAGLFATANYERALADGGISNE